jgi:D-cysteine desulfhydrase family pyridoxal phosphate-dependent enzyme
MIPRIRFAALPTPLEPAPRLSAALGGTRIFIKRDDLTGLAFGGNKTRKLEFALAEALANGARMLITVGGIQSNHCRQTAALAARYGLKCVLVLSGDPPEHVTGNTLLDQLFGAEIRWTTRSEREAVLQREFQTAWEAGDRPYLIPLGASNATGALGYAFAFDELLKQLEQDHIHPDWILVASSSAGTQAGLVLGARRAGWPGKILGISIDEPENILQEHVARIATEASQRFNENVQVTPQEVLVNADYLGAGYAIMGDPEREAIRLFARTEGLVLGPVYTARAAAGMIDLIQKKVIGPSDTVIFWHTGDTPTLFADPYAQTLFE